MIKKPSTQGISGRSGTRPPKEFQFGQPNGNPRGDGVNKEKLAARRDLQAQLREIIHMTGDDLYKLLQNRDQPRIIELFATALLGKKLESALAIWHEVFGMPKNKTDLSSSDGTMSPVLVKFAEPISQTGEKSAKNPSDDIISPKNKTKDNENAVFRKKSEE